MCMKSENVLLEDYKLKRKYKFEGLDNPVSKRGLYTHVGDYLFDNYGVSYLDLSDYDFSNLDLKDMTHIPFSSSTTWPSKSKLPKGFNPSDILRDCTTIDEEVKELHKIGITGEGVTVAVIDSSFQGGNHVEFRNARLVKATLNDVMLDDWCHFHMECVLSKLVGENLGVAPKCKVLCYEVNTDEDNSVDVVKCLNDIKKRIGAGEVIKAVNISASIEEYFECYKEYTTLVKELSSMGCEVIDSNRFGEDFFCCNSTFMDNGEDEYKEASFAQTYSPELKRECNDKINVVCSGRTLPEFCNNTGYKYEVVDCFSWSIPQIIGLYALCLTQVKDMSYDMFVSICRETSKVTKKGIRVVKPKKVVETAKKIGVRNV